MKKLLAMLLALVLALGCFGALAEAPALNIDLPEFSAMTIVDEVRVDPDALAALLPMFGAGEETMPVVKTLLSIVNSMTETLIIDDTGAQFDLALKNKDVLNLTCEQTEEGFALGSDLFPNYVVVIKNETIQELVNGMTGQLEENMANVDMEKLVENLTVYFAEYVTVCMNSVTMGEPEVGTYEFKDVATFNVKVPIQVDVEALKGAVEKLIAQLKADETFSSLLNAAQGTGVAMPNVNEEITVVIPEVNCNAYMNLDEEGYSVDGLTYVVTETTASSEGGEAVAVNVYVLVSEAGYVDVTVDIPSQNTQVAVQFAENEGAYAINLDVNAQGMYLGATVSVAMDEAISVSADLYFMDPEKALANETTVITMGGKRTATVSTENKTVIYMEDLMNQEDGTAIQTLMMDVMSNGLNGLITRAAEVMPEEIAALTTLFMGSGEEAAAAPAAQ